jgi:hypothetical protein
MRVNNKWTTDENAYIFHVQNKNLMREAIAEKGNCKKLAILKDLVIELKWVNNENNEGDPANMELIRQLWASYYAWAKKEGIPLFELPFLEKAGMKVVALYRQDSAYFERMGGIMFYFIYNMQRWKGKGKSARLQVLKDARDWWYEEDKRERTRNWIDNIWGCMISGYQKRPFWEKSINFIIDWIIDHKDQLVYDPNYDPRKWFGREKGKLNMGVHAGLA